MVKTLKIWWTRLNRKPCGKWIFSKILGFFIPYTGSISPYVRNVQPGYAEVSIRASRKTSNHLKSIHALAISNLGELTTGLAVHFAMGDNHRAILTRLESDYLKKARGQIVSTAQIDPSMVVPGVMLVDALIVDASNTLVAKVKASWLIDKIV